MDGSGSDEGQALVEGKQKEAEGSSEGAFNEETGEINWDCPVRLPLTSLGDGSLMTFSVSAVWPTDHVVKTSKLLSHALCSPKPSRKVSIASTGSKTCRTVSESIPTSTAKVTSSSSTIQIVILMLIYRMGLEIDDDAESEPISGTVSAETNTTDAPRPPNPNPPVNSPILGSTPSNQMTKSRSPHLLSKRAVLTG